MATSKSESPPPPRLLVHPKRYKLSAILSEIQKLQGTDHEATEGKETPEQGEIKKAALHLFERIVEALQHRETHGPDPSLPLTASVAITVAEMPAEQSRASNSISIDIGIKSVGAGGVEFLCN